MACVGQRNANSFGILGPLDAPMRNGHPHGGPFKKGAPRTPVQGKPQYDPRYDPRRPPNTAPPPDGINKPGFAETRGQNNGLCPVPPRFRNQQAGLCCPAPAPCLPITAVCPPVVVPCPPAPPTCSAADIEFQNAQLKQQLLQMQRASHRQPSKAPPTQPNCTPILPNKDTPRPISTPQSNQNKVEKKDAAVPSTPTQPIVVSKQPPPEVKACMPSERSDPIEPPDKVNVNLPAPPGLPKPSGRGVRFQRQNRKRGERRLDPAVEDANLVQAKGPEAVSRVVSPPPSGVAPAPVKLPQSKVTQPVPRSPTTTVSSSSGDSSGGSSVRFGSDTTFTSVATSVSNVSDKVSQHHPRPRPICQRWMKGYPCYRQPCIFFHPPRSDQPANSAMQPKELPPGPPLFATTVSDHIKVQFDQGFEVRDVVTGFESRWVHLGNIASSVTSTALSKLLEPYKVEGINLPESPSGKPVTAKVQFTSPADAIKAVAGLNGTELAQKTITARLAINNSTRGNMVLADSDVQLVWECPFRVGYAGYDTLKEARVAIDSLNRFPMEYLVVSAQLYEGLPCVGAYNVMFKQLPASVTEESLRKLANSKAVMLGRPNYQSLDKAIRFIRSRLEEYGTVARFDVIPAPYRDGLVKAWAQFTSPAEARAAQDDMDHRRPKATGHTTISCRHVVSLTHVMNAESYKKMREDIGWLRWSWQRRYGFSAFIRDRVKEISIDDSPAYIRLSSERPELLSSLKYEFEQLLQGETVTLAKKPLWDDFLITKDGYAYIAQLQTEYPGIQIQVQNKRRVVSLWGPIVMRHRARQDIVRKVMELKAQQFWKIPLSGKVLGIFCSAELSTLQELLGADNCILDIGERVLVVRGNDLAFRTACKAIQDAQSRQGGEVRTSDAAICPVCFGEAIVPVSLACGHQWCRACLSGYLTSAVENKMFPLRCLGNDATCTQCIPLGLSRTLLSTEEFSAVIDAAFWVYVHSRPDEFYHCPTPDCTQVYRAAPASAVLQCPSCLVRICPSCRIEYHDGMTCEERDVADDKLFKEWTSHNDVKSCPGCKAPIERSEGCNHMTCTRCQTHICWECLATFPKGQGIYDHMRAQHGSIGL